MSNGVNGSTSLPQSNLKTFRKKEVNNCLKLLFPNLYIYLYTIIYYYNLYIYISLIQKCEFCYQVSKQGSEN